MFTVVGNRLSESSSNPGRGCISHSANTLRGGMNPTIFLTVMDK